MERANIIGVDLAKHVFQVRGACADGSVAFRKRISHIPRHSAYRSQFAVVAYPWHPLHGQRIRVYGRQGRAGPQILYIEVRPGGFAPL